MSRWLSEKTRKKKREYIDRYRCDRCGEIERHVYNDEHAVLFVVQVMNKKGKICADCLKELTDLDKSCDERRKFYQEQIKRGKSMISGSSSRDVGRLCHLQNKWLDRLKKLDGEKK